MPDRPVTSALVASSPHSSSRKGEHSLGLAVLTVLALLLCACSRGSSDPKPTSPDAVTKCTADRVGGDMIVTGALPDSLDPAGPANNVYLGGQVLDAVYDTLMTFDPNTGEVTPRVAESLTANSDSTVWTLALRPGVTFGNGNALTADAVVSSIERYKDPDLQSASLALASTIETVTATDDLTVEFTLTSPWSGFPSVLAGNVGMVVDPDVLGDLGDNEFAKLPVGAGVGAFEVVSNAPGEAVVLKGKDEYWGGAVCISQLRFVPTTGAKQSLDALKSGGAQVGLIADPQVVANAEQDGFQTLASAQFGADGLAMNSGVGATGTPPATADVRVRQAVQAALNPEAFNERLYGGTATATSAVFDSSAGPLHPDVDGPAYDPELARELIGEAKADGWDGSIRLAVNSLIVDQSVVFETMLEAVGFDVEVESYETDQFVQKLIVTRDYDLAVAGMAITTDAIWTTLDRLFSSTSPGNYYQFSSPEMDAALAALKAAGTPEEVKSGLAQFQMVWNEAAPAANVTTTPITWAFATDVGGLALDSGQVVRFEQAFINE